ncbi:putative PaaK: phenylacetate-CoA ligase (Aerobic) [Desulfosarcina cetonica]|uniref:phenylacetate--CoA ligase family protein n=1 Tax=Desulfosarcina cetonica TaxID=90730 RepID=UPI0006D0DA20|nr:phenylacetate--CoA ligase family protein [Desulfosarcina cetonica]VTR64045.1 putative PaaK: phenylacetate-CoA ligase (Aerobic) [Desulfosarcina cetonica]
MDPSVYWNPILETMPREKLQALQLKKFKRIFTWAYDNSPFYRRLYRDAGIEPGDIKTFADIRKVPKIEKSMMREIQGPGKNNYPYGDILCVPKTDVCSYRQTSGTTGQPVYQADSWQDWEWGIEAYSHALWAQTYRNTDRMLLPFGYNIFVAFWAAHYAAEKLGVEVVPGGVLNTEARILKMQELEANAMAATVSYVLNMGRVAREKMGIDPAKDLNIQKITVAGEPGGSIPATRQRMEELWGAKVYDQCGSTEIGHWGWECHHQAGLHVNEAFFLFEIEDLETGEIITEPGKKGRLVATALDRTAQPCIRFDAKDIIQWNAEPCACGRSFWRLDGGIIGRADDITKVKGVLWAPSAVEEVVRGFAQLSDEYQIILSKKGDADQIELKVELMPGYENNEADVRHALLAKLRLQTNLNYLLDFKTYGDLPRFEGKGKRFQDLRHN